MVRGGKRGGPFRDLRDPDQRLITEQGLLGGLPSLRPDFGPRPITRKVDKLSCIRFASRRYSVPAGLIGQTVTVLVDAVTKLTGEITDFLTCKRRTAANRC